MEYTINHCYNNFMIAGLETELKVTALNCCTESCSSYELSHLSGLLSTYSIQMAYFYLYFIIVSNIIGLLFLNHYIILPLSFFLNIIYLCIKQKK